MVEIQKYTNNVALFHFKWNIAALGNVAPRAIDLNDSQSVS